MYIDRYLCTKDELNQTKKYEEQYLQVKQVYIYIYIYIYICMCSHICIYLCAHINMHIYIYQG